MGKIYIDGRLNEVHCHASSSFGYGVENGNERHRDME